MEVYSLKNIRITTAGSVAPFSNVSGTVYEGQLIKSVQNGEYSYLDTNGAAILYKSSRSSDSSNMIFCKKTGVGWNCQKVIFGTVDTEPNVFNTKSLITSSAVASEIVTCSFVTLTGTGDTVSAGASNSCVTENSVLLAAEVGTPSAVVGRLTVTISNGFVFVSGKINGSTTLKLHLGRSGGTNIANIATPNI